MIPSSHILIPGFHILLPFKMNIGSDFILNFNPCIHPSHVYMLAKMWGVGIFFFSEKYSSDIFIGTWQFT